MSFPDKLSEILGLLEPIAEQDWHGKWRIKKVIELCRSEQQHKHPLQNLSGGCDGIGGSGYTSDESTKTPGSSQK